MRPQSPLQITIKDKIIGGPRSLVCLPLMASDHKTLEDQAREAVVLEPDLIEWRVDAFHPLSRIDAVEEAARAYPWKKTYKVFPGPNSNTFTAWIGQQVPELSLKPCVDALVQLLQRPVAFAEDCIGPTAETAAAALAPGEVLLLENLRFHPGETKNDAGFAGGLAALADAYVNDAFGSAQIYRKHLDVGGDYAFRLRGESHVWTPATISKLQHAVRGGPDEKGYENYAAFAESLNKTATTFKDNQNIFGKVYFPRLVVPTYVCDAEFFESSAFASLLPDGWAVRSAV